MNPLYTQTNFPLTSNFHKKTPLERCFILFLLPFIQFVRTLKPFYVKKICKQGEIESKHISWSLYTTLNLQKQNNINFASFFIYS